MSDLPCDTEPPYNTVVPFRPRVVIHDFHPDDALPDPDAPFRLTADMPLRSRDPTQEHLVTQLRRLHRGVEQGAMYRRAKRFRKGKPRPALFVRVR